MMAVRKAHSYIGAFIAPSVLFFAVTGGLQLFSLHEAHADYKPPALIQKLGQLHKKQTLVMKPARPRPVADAKASADRRKGPEAAKAIPVSVTALKWLFLLVAAGLAISTLLGVWMALAFSRSKGTIWLLLGAGAVLPILLALM